MTTGLTMATLSGYALSMATTHRARLTDDYRLALAFAVLGVADYPSENLDFETLTAFKKKVDARWTEKLGAYQKARDAWALQHNATALKAQTYATAQSKLDAAEARAKRDVDAWERLAPSEQEAGREEYERRTVKTGTALAKLRSAQSAAKNAAVSAERATTKLREAFDTTFDEMMDARRAEELARALPAVWAGDEQATAWFERQVAIVRAYSPMLGVVLDLT